MQREEFGLTVPQLRRVGFERFGDLRVQLPAGIAQQAAMGGVLHQRVLKGIDRIGRRAALKDQPGGDDASESGLQFVL